MSCIKFRREGENLKSSTNFEKKSGEQNSKNEKNAGNIVKTDMGAHLENQTQKSSALTEQNRAQEDSPKSDEQIAFMNKTQGQNLLTTHAHQGAQKGALETRAHEEKSETREIKCLRKNGGKTVIISSAGSSSSALGSCPSSEVSQKE